RIKLSADLIPTKQAQLLPSEYQSPNSGTNSSNSIPRSKKSKYSSSVIENSSGCLIQFSFSSGSQQVQKGSYTLTAFLRFKGNATWNMSACSLYISKISFINS